jgi:hypothetical protein
VRVLIVIPRPPHHIGRLDTLFLLPALVGLSIALIIITLLYKPVTNWLKRTFGKHKTYTPIFEDDGDYEQATPAPAYMPSKGLFNDLRAHVDDIGGYIFGFELARLVCLAALLGLSIYATIVAQAPSLPKQQAGAMGLEDGSVEAMRKKHGKHGKKKHRQKNPALNDLSTQEWAEFSVSAFYVRLPCCVLWRSC